MKSGTVVVAIALFAALGLQAPMAAQHAQYKVIDLGTLGGPSAYGQGDGPGTTQLINGAGTVVGLSDTSIPDPNAPNCQNPDCLVSHAFRWQDGVLTDLGSLSGV